MQRQLRNIGIIAHVDAGKTTVSERILFYTGKIHASGDVHRGNTALDFDPEERDHGITINSAATTVYWNGVQINLIDTPGHIDFNIEVNRSLRVLDGAVVVFDAVAGVEPQTETNWRLADRYGVPRLCFVNKLDRAGADFDRVVQMMRTRLRARPLVLQLPIGSEGSFRGVADVVELRALTWPADGPAVRGTPAAVPPELLAQAQALHQAVVEAAAEHDDAVMAAWLEGRQPDAAQLRAALRKGTIAGALVPVLVGSALRNKGVDPLLDAVLHYLPAPEDVPAGAEPEGPFAALAFKVVVDKHGAMTFLRVYRGRARGGEVLLNANTGRRERLVRVYEVHADKREERDGLQAGDIVGVVGLKETLTGHTLCDPGHPVVLEQISVPEPVIHVAVEPRTQADQHNLGRALHAVCQEDPSLRLRQDAESGQTILSGMGELQLEVTVEKLRRRFDVEVRLGAPQVAYRETIAGAAEVHHVLRKQTGGPGQYAEVRLRLEPLARGEGLRFDSRIVGGAIPREYIPAVEAGVRRAAQAGVLAAYPGVDLLAVLLDGAYHERDSSSLAFENAAAAAFRECFMQAQPRLLEPLMTVEVVTPPPHVGDCIGDLARRRGEIRGQEARGDDVVLQALVPLREMFGYVGRLRALTSGRAQYTMQFECYAEAPAAVREAVLKQ